MLTLDEAVRARHSVRNFTQKQVDGSVLRKIIDAGRLAPSAKNRQPWRFLIATEEQRQVTADILEAQAAKERDAGSTVGATARIVRDAPVLVAVFMPEGSMAQESDWISLGACLENMCLKATDLGLGSLIVCDSQPCKEELRTLFGRREAPSSFFLVGYEGKPCPRAPKLPLEAVAEGIPAPDEEERAQDDLPEADITDQPFLFISYSHRDADIVIADIVELKKHGVRLWYDRSILYGKKWDKEVLDVMRKGNCAGVLVYISENSARSEAVAAEMEFAAERFADADDRVIGVHIGGRPLCGYFEANKRNDESFRKVFTEKSKFLSRSRTAYITDAVPELAKEAVRLGAAAESGVYDEFRYVRIPGGVSVTAYYGSSVCVVLPARIAGLPVLSLGKNMFRANERVQEVTVPDGVLRIEDGAFAGMTSLRHIVLPDSITFLGVAAFRGCTSLEQIRLPQGLTKLEEALFRECTSLRECDVPPDVKEFGEAVFHGCTCLQSVDMPSVLRMTEGAFYGCAALQRLNVSPLLEGVEENSFLTCPLLDAVVSGMHFCKGKKGRVVKL